MDVDGQSQARRQRRHQKWAVGLQPQTARPTACKDCLTVFATGDVRATTWGSRSTSRWCCLPCVSKRAATTDEVEPVGDATIEHKAAVESAVAAEASISIAVPLAATGMHAGSDEAVREAWDQNRIPNSGWFDDLSWESLLKLGATTYVQIPERFRGAVLTARRKTLEALAAATDEGEDSTSAWKLTLLLDSLLLSSSRAGGATCAELLEERLAWFWGGQWAELWTDAAGRPPPTTQTPATSKQTAARVHTLAAAGEISRALGSVTSAKLAPRTADTFTKLRNCFPPRASNEAWQPAPRPAPDEELQEAVKREAQRLLRRPPKLTAPGLLGTRLEHLADLTDDPDTLTLLTKLLVRVAFGHLPEGVLHTLRSGELVALAKGANDVRPLLIGSTLRRLALRALARARKQQLADACGPNQYGVGRKGGASLLLKCLQAQAEKRPDAAIVKVDLKTAFQKLDREVAFQAMAAAEPLFEPALRTWYSGEATHYWRDAAGRFEKIGSTRGFDQGCPLAAAAFAVGQKQPLDNYLLHLRQLDTEARLYSYLDDSYIVVRKDLVTLALAGLKEAYAPLGLELNPDKTLVWSPSGAAGLPAEALAHWTDKLPVLGKQLKAAGDTDDAPAYLDQDDSSLEEATARLQKLWNSLRPLLDAGLKRQAAASLLISYAGAASQHALQLSLCSEEDAKTYDRALKAAWDTLAERQLDDAAALRLGLPTKLGGAGVQWATTRRCAAFWVGWTTLATEVRKDAVTKLWLTSWPPCLAPLPNSTKPDRACPRRASPSLKAPLCPML